MIDIAGLVAAALLLVTLVALEVRHAGPIPAAPSERHSSRERNGKIAVAVLWLLFFTLLSPRLLGLLT